MQGKIVKIISNDFTVSSEKTYICKARGKFRNMKVTPIVGDNVIFDETKKYIMQILPRKNALIRPVIANIDQAFIIVSVKDPDLDLYLLDKLLVTIEFNNIKPIICFTKLDLLSNTCQIIKYRQYYEKIGYQVFFNNELDTIRKCFNHKITVFTGQSGAGKSTLLNSLNKTLNIKTDQISHALGRGKHTTRHVELITMENGLIADTPGFSSLEFDDMQKSDIRDNFVEFNTYKENCKYQDCMHDKEDMCEIKKRIPTDILASRYANYLKFIHKL